MSSVHGLTKSQKIIFLKNYFIAMGDRLSISNNKLIIQKLKNTQKTKKNTLFKGAIITGRKIHNFAKLPRVIKMLVSEIY